MNRIGFSSLFSALVLVFPLLGNAGNDAGHGGDAVVCFDISASEAMKDGQLTEMGRKHIISAVTSEYYRIRMLSKDSNTLKNIKTMKRDEVVTHILGLTKPAANFYFDLSKISATIPKIEEGFGSMVSLFDVTDEGTKFPLPSQCAMVQVVVMQQDMFYRDADIYNRFDELNKGLIQLHEIFFALGRDLSPRYHLTSEFSQLLLISLVGFDLTAETLRDKVLQYHFLNFREDYDTKKVLAIGVDTISQHRDRWVAQNVSILRDYLDILEAPPVDIGDSKYFVIPQTLVSRVNDLVRRVYYRQFGSFVDLFFLPSGIESNVESFRMAAQDVFPIVSYPNGSGVDLGYDVCPDNARAGCIPFSGPRKQNLSDAIRKALNEATPIIKAQLDGDNWMSYGRIKFVY